MKMPCLHKLFTAHLLCIEPCELIGSLLVDEQVSGTAQLEAEESCNKYQVVKGTEGPKAFQVMRGTLLSHMTFSPASAFPF